MAADSNIPKTSSVIADPDNTTVFFGKNNVAYNWKTQQWTRQPAWDGLDYYQRPSAGNKGVGIVRFSGSSVHLQHGFPVNPGMYQDSTITTGAVDPNQGGRTVVNGVRPLINGGTTTVRVGVQDSIGGAVSWSTATSLNSRTNMANFRSEGRYVRFEFSTTGEMETALGADIDVKPQGRV